MAEQFTLNKRDIVYVTAAPVTRWNRIVRQLLPTAIGLNAISEFAERVHPGIF